MPLAAVVLTGVGSGLNVAALVLLVGASIGGSARISTQFTPNPWWLVDRSEDGTWRLPDHQRSLLRGMARDVDVNAIALTKVVRRRRRGLHLLFSAVVLYGIGAFYILVESVGP